MIWAWPTKLIYIIVIRVNSIISSNSHNNNHKNSRQCKGSYILHKRIDEPQKIMRTKLHQDEIWYSGNRAKTLHQISFKKITVRFAFFKANSSRRKSGKSISNLRGIVQTQAKFHHQSRFKYKLNLGRTVMTAEVFICLLIKSSSPYSYVLALCVSI